MKIHLLADLHLEFLLGGATNLSNGRALLQVLNDTGADVRVIAGDTCTRGRCVTRVAELFPERPVIMVAGNHDYYGGVVQKDLEKMREAAKRYPHIHFLENDAVVMGDVVFLGCTLWSDFRLFESGPCAGLYSMNQVVREVAAGMNDYLQIRFQIGGRYRFLQPGDTVKRHFESVAWLQRQFEHHRGRKIVVVTHHAPSFRSIAEGYREDVLSAAYASHLDDLVARSGAALWVHGHVHDRVDYAIGPTRVLANCCGYSFDVATDQGFRADMVVEV